MTKLNDDINALIVPAMRTVEGRADAIEALANGIAGVLAITASGDMQKANALLTGTEGYIQNCLADKLAMMRKLG